MTPRVFSGIQPTGAIHIGNYVGAIRNWIRLQERAESYFCIVDYHAITTPYSPKDMPVRVYEAALDILASGLDPERCVFFVQSDVPEHTELAWALSSLASMGALERMTQFKEKSERLEYVNAGLFTYPVLQAADILLYRAGLVPVGEDQLQHLELTREIARRFNHNFGAVFPEPKAEMTPAARVMALNEPTRKMSKSIAGSFIGLAETDAEIRKKISRAVTDTGPAEGEMGPGVKNLFTLLQAFDAPEQVKHFQEQYEAGTLRYSELKPAVGDAIVAELAPIRARREELNATPRKVWDALEQGAERARAVASVTMQEVRCALGLRGGRG
jgi:tryptophanyl-tRNA synthetase